MVLRIAPTEAVGCDKTSGDKGRRCDLDPQEVLNAVRRPSSFVIQRFKEAQSREAQDTGTADGVLDFAFYMLSLRAANIDVHRQQYAERMATYWLALVQGTMVDCSDRRSWH